jgi:hypothetical protein
MTAEEKAQKYKEMQLEFFNSCVKDLSEEEQALVIKRRNLKRDRRKSLKSLKRFSRRKLLRLKISIRIHQLKVRLQSKLLEIESLRLSKRSRRTRSS